jgi:hypothetical protein
MAASKLALHAMSMALSEQGTAEVPRGSNWGSPKDDSDVDDFLRSVGINFPAAWCAAFVYWCYMKAAEQIKVANPVPKTGGVLAMWNAAKAQRVTGMPLAGDVFVMDFGGGKGHTGIVVKVVGIYIETIEGNTNDEGSREGYEVAKRRRLITECKGFLRF